MLSLAILLASASVAAPSCATGNWALQASGQTLFRLDIKATPAGATATWERPENWEIEDGESFSHITGPVVRRPALAVKSVNGELEISFDDPRPGATPDNFHVHCVDAGHLNVTYLGTGFEPFDVVKDEAKGVALGPWDSGRSYRRVINRPTNAEMTAIFDADQADRQPDRIDWSVVGPADEKRRARTEQLLDSGALQSGDDFYHAAFIFQHGAKADDYLKAHLLATIAVARGKSGAVWIASATLDRYLRAIDKPQVLGTQYRMPKGAAVTQEPYDRTLVSDAMRKALQVPSLAEQEQQRQRYAAKALEAKKP